MKKLPFLLNILFAIPLLHAQTIDVSADPENRTTPAFIGTSTEFMYSIMRGEVNALGNAYDTAYVDDGVLSEMPPLNLHHLRFPGGTVSQYYHFRGQNGYGTIPEDLECRPGFIHLPNMIQKTQTDQYYPENLIVAYESLVDNAATDDEVETLYVLNLMSHFFHGDLVPLNGVLDTLIDHYAAPLGAYLDASPRFLDTAQVKQVASILLAIFEEPIIDELQAYLLQQPGFLFRVGDNIDAINYLLSRDMTITGIELGNENFAYTMLKDDDLSEYPYDCTTPDSIVVQIGSIPLTTRAYMQALLKYALLSEIYAGAIHLNTDIPVGAVMTPNEFRVEFLDIDSFIILPSSSERARYYEMWNRFIGHLDFYDAYMPHFYMNSIPECGAFDGISADSITLFGESYLDFYFSDILPNQLNTFKEQVSDRPLWITEWNINTANIFGNTFFHASHCFRFMNFMNKMKNVYDIDLINYHNLSAWNYNQFALLRTEDVDSEFTVIRQAMYYSFMLMGDLHEASPFVSSLNMAEWLGEAATTSPHHFYQPYLSADGDRLYLHYINLSDDPVDVDLQNVQFSINDATGGQALKAASSGSMRIVNAGSIFSSDRGCDDYPEYHDAYTFEEFAIDSDDTELPPYSLGLLQLDLATVSGGNEYLWNGRVKLYPNPASEFTAVSIPSELSAVVHQIEVSDITGKILVSLPFADGIIDVGQLTSGYYLVQLTDEQGQPLAAKQLIVSHK